jgi:hypothetical protein
VSRARATLLRRTGIVPNTALRNGSGSAAHHAASVVSPRSGAGLPVVFVVNQVGPGSEKHSVKPAATLPALIHNNSRYCLALAPRLRLDADGLGDIRSPQNLAVVSRLTLADCSHFAELAKG